GRLCVRGWHGGLLRQYDFRLRAQGAGARQSWGPGATTLEWTLPSPPPFHQFDTLPRIVGPSLDGSALENANVESANGTASVESSAERPSREPRSSADIHRH